MRRFLSSVCVASSLVLALGACGIKGAPRPPSPPPAPPTETQPTPQQDTERGPIEPSGPTIAPGPSLDGGTIVPGSQENPTPSP
ncbi:hypothetical protein [Pyxidicoccus fallax]|nr:hypothetical protein [Pyxidicoccus fallax]